MAWPAGLPDFGRFNLIYGWNATGKTTLSSLFRNIERREPLTDGAAEFLLEGTACDLTTISPSDSLPQVRVFNRDFVAANVLTSQLEPIFYFGADSVEKQKQVEKSRLELAETQRQQLEGETALRDARADVEDFCTQQAKQIKILLSSSGGDNPYNNYDKRLFKDACKKVRESGRGAALLTPDIRDELIQQKESKPKPSIDIFSVAVPDTESLSKRTAALLKEKVVSKAIDELVRRPEVAAWVETGLGLHLADGAEKCAFCDQLIPAGRLQELKSHFDDAYKHFLERVEAALAEVRSQKEFYKQLHVPEHFRFYDHLFEPAKLANEQVATVRRKMLGHLETLESSLTAKRQRAFESLPAEFAVPDQHRVTQLVDDTNEIIQRHNDQTANFHATIATARLRLEHGHVAEALQELETKEKLAADSDSQTKQFRETATRIQATITTLERDILEHRRPAEELNAELASYLGRTDLTLQVSDTGYLLMRDGVQATNLSEGEKTAFAFLYFLKSLQDKSFDLKKSVIVVDDPVSSLDINSLFGAFGFMKERTKEAGQLFVLTHNFTFFRQAKNWLSYLNKGGQHRACFYMLRSAYDDGHRTCVLAELDELLHEYESEYHYLFKRVYEEANRQGPEAQLKMYYEMPNIARRLLETFLAFRYPALSGSLHQQFDKAGYEAAKKARIFRFLHTHSHDDAVAEPEHDLSILSETPQVLKEVLEFIKSEDPHHYAEMSNLVAPTIQVSSPVATGAAP